MVLQLYAEAEETPLFRGGWASLVMPWLSCKLKTKKKATTY